MKILYKINVALASSSMMVLMASGSAGAVSGSGSDGSGSRTEIRSTTTTRTESSSNSTGTEVETEHAPEATDDSKAAQSGAPKSEMTQAEKDAKKQANKMRLCQKHEGLVRNTASRIADRAQKHLDLFTTIATRTETFYTTKGKTLANYDALVADVNAKKAAAQTAVDALKTEAPNVTCDDTGVISASAATFKADAKTTIGLLKEYKTSVKNLIVGVKSVQSDDSSATTGGSN